MSERCEGRNERGEQCIHLVFDGQEFCPGHKYLTPPVMMIPDDDSWPSFVQVMRRNGEIRAYPAPATPVKGEPVAWEVQSRDPRGNWVRQSVTFYPEYAKRHDGWATNDPTFGNQEYRCLPLSYTHPAEPEGAREALREALRLAKDEAETAEFGQGLGPGAGVVHVGQGHHRRPRLSSQRRRSMPDKACETLRKCHDAIVLHHKKWPGQSAADYNDLAVAVTDFLASQPAATEEKDET